jgi:hypothetical protein
MAELEIAGTAALGGCVGDEKKSRRAFKKAVGKAAVSEGLKRTLSGTSKV